MAKAVDCPRIRDRDFSAVALAMVTEIPPEKASVLPGSLPLSNEDRTRWTLTPALSRVASTCFWASADDEPGSGSLTTTPASVMATRWPWTAAPLMDTPDAAPSAPAVPAVLTALETISSMVSTSPIFTPWSDAVVVAETMSLAASYPVWLVAAMDLNETAPPTTPSPAEAWE